MKEQEIGVNLINKLITPISFLFLYVLVSQICNAIYFANGLEPTGTFYIFSSLGFFLTLAYWFKEDCRKYKIPWLIDMGFFVYFFWFLIIPIHLFQTRGMRAFITISIFVGIYLLAYLISLIIFFLIK